MPMANPKFSQASGHKLTSSHVLEESCDPRNEAANSSPGASQTHSIKAFGEMNELTEKMSLTGSVHLITVVQSID
jgi:hypothetical protein